VRTGSTAVRTSLVAAVPVGLLLSVAVVWQSTAAAFTASTDNAGNTWQAGSVVLADSDGGSALFDTTRDGALVPGATRSRCIRVDYTGSLPADIRLYVTTPAAGATTLDPYLVVSVEEGQPVPAGTTVAADCSTGFTAAATPAFLYNTASAAGPSADQTSTMSALKSGHADYATGLVAGLSVAQNTSLTFRVAYTVKDDNLAQSTQSKATFTWEARNS
jgi:hypothetical protein